MTDNRDDGVSGKREGTQDGPDGAFVAGRYESGTISYPPHPVCPETNTPLVEYIDLSDRRGEVLTWTTATTTPPGVRTPNTLAIVSFEIRGQEVRALGGTTADVSVGDRVRPVYVEQLRDPTACVRETDSQRWDGVRFAPVERAGER